MKNLAIITARSGSKGLIDKNIKLLHGKPLMAYSIEAAIDSSMFDEIMVSTDSTHYAEIAKNFGAKVPFLRSLKASSDSASSWEVVKEVISRYKDAGMEFDTVTLLQPTSPFRTAGDIIKGYTIMDEKKANLVVAVCELEHSPLWSNTLPDDNSLESFIRPEVVYMQRQLMKPYYRINGALYIIKTDYLMNVRDIYSQRSYALIMDKRNSIDIDDEIDFNIAEAIMTVYKNMR